jgi:large subunit ribosomal protein L4
VRTDRKEENLMPKIDVYNIEGKKVSDVELAEGIFGIEPNEAIVHSVVVNYMANQRQGTQNTKTRSEVSGGGRKPWRQKGTGRARQGSIRAPQWIKGGIALGPKPRSYKYRVNKKEKKLAVRSVLSSKVLENKIVVLDALSFNEIKTKNMVKVLNNLKIQEKAMIVLPEKNENVQISARNIQGVKTSLATSLNAYELLKYSTLVITLDALKKIEEVYA